MRKLLALLAVSFALLTNALAASVTLEWNPNTEPNLAGYRLYWGTSSRVYTSSMTILVPKTTATVTGLSPGVTYYFAVTAFTTDGLESDYSDEVSYTVPGLPVPPPGPVALSADGISWKPDDDYVETVEMSRDLIDWKRIPTELFTLREDGTLFLPRSFFPIDDPQRFFRIRRDPR